MAAHYLKRWLHLHRSATRVISFYPGVCCPSVLRTPREAQLNLLPVLVLLPIPNSMSWAYTCSWEKISYKCKKLITPS